MHVRVYGGARGRNKSRLIATQQINQLHEKGYITTRQAIEMVKILYGIKKEEDIRESDSTGTRDSDADQ